MPPLNLSCVAQLFIAHASARLKSQPCLHLTVCHVCCCASFHLHVVHVRLTLTRHSHAFDCGNLHLTHTLSTNQTHTKTTTGKSHFDYYCGFVYNYNYDLSYTFQFKLYFFETCVKIFILTWCSDNVLWKRRPTRANRYFATLSTYSEETVLVVGTSACNTAEEVSNTFGPRIQNLRVGPPTLRLCRIISDRETLPPAVPQQKFRRGVCFAATPQTRC